MLTFLLIHGGLHGGWCWDKVVPKLQRAGYGAVAPDLPGMGSDQTPLKTVTMASWAAFVASLVRDIGDEVVLVGHSRGGPVISEAAELVPELVLGLVYVSAALLPAGTRVLEYVSDEVPGLREGIIVDAEGISYQMEQEVARARFYNRTDRATADWAIAHLTPEPIAPTATPLEITPARWGRLPRAYIECMDDRALPLQFQRAMQARLPCNPVLSIDTDHSPFLSAPDTLAQHLIQIAGAFRCESIRLMRN